MLGFSGTRPDRDRQPAFEFVQLELRARNEVAAEAEMTKRLVVLLAVVLALVRCWNPFSSDLLCHSINAVNSGGFAVACPTGATRFCAVTPIVATSSSEAHGACDACFGPGACSLSIACGTGPDAASWEGALTELHRPTSYTEYQFVTSRLVAAGDISSGWLADPACLPQGKWAP